MADIQLRLGTDTLVIAPRVQNQLQIESIEFALLFEPEIFEDPFQLQKLTGANCLVAPTANLTPARLAHTGFANAAEQLAQEALRVTANVRPEHVLVELAPCGLPLNPQSKASLVENRTQYERAAKLFANMQFDAFFLNGFTRVADLKSALMGIRKISDAPIIASVDVAPDGTLQPATPDAQPLVSPDVFEEAIQTMAEFEANAAGFCTASLANAVALTKCATETTSLPLLVQLCEPADAFDAAVALQAAGAQLLRATGPAALANTTAFALARQGDGSSVLPSDDFADASPSNNFVGASLLAPKAATTTNNAEHMEALASKLRTSVNEALGLESAE